MALSSDEAFKVIANIKPNGTLPDTYSVASITLSKLKNSEDERFDSVDVKTILKKLKDLNKEENRVSRVLSIISSKDLLDTYDKTIGNFVYVDGLRIDKSKLRETLLERLI